MARLPVSIVTTYSIARLQPAAAESKLPDRSTNLDTTCNRVWRREDEGFHLDSIDYKKQTTGTGMMFWGAFR